MARVFWRFSVFSKNIYIKTLRILSVVSCDSDASESPTGSSYELIAVPNHYVVVREAELCTYTLNQTELSQPLWLSGSVVSQLSSLSRVRLLSPKSAGVDSEGTPRNPLVAG